MTTSISTQAVESSTYIVTASFTDENGDAVTPNELTWSLRNGSGTIVNDRDGVSLTPDTAVEIVLGGADLLASDGSHRYLTVVGTYDSDAGSDLPIVDECDFAIANLVGV